MNRSTLYQELLQKISTHISSLPDKPEETPDGILRALWHMASAVSMSVHQAHETDLPELDRSGVEKLRDLVVQRIAGAPLAYLTGWQRFMGLEFMVDPRALIPRMETELLVHSAIKMLDLELKTKKPVTIVDICTGSGNIALSLAHQIPQAQVYGSDISHKAIELARSNARNLELQERVHFFEGDLFTPFDNASFYDKIDMITCNPPYISSGKVDTLHQEIINHEPRMAFDGGAFGVSILNRFAQEAPRFLRKGGWIALEVGVRQGPSVLKRLQQQNRFGHILPVQDSSGEIRVILASV